MAWFRALLKGLKILSGRDEANREMDEELGDFLVRAAEEQMRRGKSPEEAWRIARAQMGSAETVKEKIREAGWEAAVGSLWQDIRFSFRQLIRNPGFAAATIASLAMGIGATVSVFSIIYALLLHPYPYPDVERLASLQIRNTAGTLDFPTFSVSQLQVIQQAHTVESVAGYTNWSLTMTGGDVPEIANAFFFTGDSFRTFGLAPLLGRNLEPADDPPGKDPLPVAELSYSFWQKHFNGNRGILGRTLELNHQPYTIVGVTRPRFSWGEDTDVYLPQRLTNDSKAGQLWAMVRLRPGVSYEAANAELQAVLQRFDQAEPGKYPVRFRVNLQSLNAWVVRDLGGTLYLLFGAVCFLLAIGCGNASILLLARGTARQQELAMRLALGADGSRIVRQLLTEAVVLSLTGAGLGILLAYQALRWMLLWLPHGEYDSFLHGGTILVNVPVLLFSVGLALLSGILCGVFPALQIIRSGLGKAAPGGSRKMIGSVQGKRTHGMLVAGQIALTMLLLTGAARTVEGFLELLHIPLGFDPHNVLLVMMPSGPGDQPIHWQEQVNHFEQLREKVAEIPEVSSVAFSSWGVFPRSGWDQAVEIEGKASVQENHAALNLVGSEFFNVFRIPLREGRVWSHDETVRGATLALVNRAFVKEYFPNTDPLGRSVRLPHFKSNPPYMAAAPGSDGWLQIIGVVGDAQNDGLGKPVKSAVYVPYSMGVWKGAELVVRTRTEPLSVLHRIQQQLAAVSSDQTVDTASSHSVEDLIRQQPEWIKGRLISSLFTLFSVLALMLAAVGLYSVVSYSVVQRTSEFGIRMALGAQKRDVLRAALSSTGRHVALGIIVGFVLCFSLERVFDHWVDNNSHNPFLAVGASLLLFAVAALAASLPARRALAVDPMIALRCE